MIKKGWLLSAAKHPVETITFIISAGLFAFACYMLSPVYATNYVSPLTINFSQDMQEFVIAVYFALTSATGLIFPFIKKKKLSTKLVKLASFFNFSNYLFLVILRVITVGWFPFSWMPMITVAFISGVNRLFLEIADK
jgi:hypothetical protein